MNSQVYFFLTWCISTYVNLATVHHCDQKATSNKNDEKKSLHHFNVSSS